MSKSNLFSWRKKCGHSKFKLEADFGGDPIWCNTCSENLDIDDFPISEELKDELFDWMIQYKKIPMDQHNLKGTVLLSKLKGELGAEYPIVFRSQ